MAALLAAACPRPPAPASGDAGPGGAGALGPRAAGPQAGGETAWLRTLAGGLEVEPRGLAPAARGRVAASIAQRQPDGSTALLLAALEPTGAAAWSRTFAPPCALDLRPLGTAPSGALAVLARSDCREAVAGLGAEPVPPGGSAVLLDADGGFLRSVAPPPGTVVAAGLDGSGSFVLLLLPSGPAAELVVVGLAEDGRQLWRAGAAGAARLSAASTGGAVLAFADPRPRLVRIGADGAHLWTAELPASFDLLDVAVLTDGAVAALGSLPLAVEWGRGSGGGSTSYTVIALEPDGSPRTASDVDDAPRTAAAPSLFPLPHGRLLLLGFAECELVRGLTPQLEKVWTRRLDEACHASARLAAATTAGQVALAGARAGRSDFGAGFIAEGAPQEAFILGLWP
jgi:hypothetical protein